MDFLDKLDIELNSIEKELKEKEKNEIKQSSIVIENYSEDLFQMLNNTIINNKNIKKLIKEELTNKIIDIYKQILDKTYEIIRNLNTETKESIIIILNNNIINEEIMKNVEKIYYNKIEELLDLNNGFLKTISQDYDMFIYKLTCNLEKLEVKKYNKITSIIDKNKKDLFDDLSNVILDKKKTTKNIFKYSFIPLIKDIKKYKEEKLKSNEAIVINHAINLFNNNVKITLNNYTKETHNYIDEHLDECSLKINQLNKIANKKHSNKQLLLLKEYLFSFNNTLFEKNNKILINMGQLLKNNSDKIELEFKNYSANLNSIYNLNYNFEKIFYEYKEANQNILINSKTYDKINNIVLKTEHDIEKEFNITTVSLFKDNIEYLNSLIYKILLIKYKSLDYSETITTKTLQEIFNSK